MVTVLVTTLVLLVLISFAIYRWQRVQTNYIARVPVPPPPDFEGLFADSVRQEQARLDSADLAQGHVEMREELLSRAKSGDKVALLEAEQTGDKNLYDDILNTLVRRAENDRQLLALTSYIARSDNLRVNRTLASAFTESWKRTPTRHATAELLHLAAMVGDAAYYHQTIDLVTEVWRKRHFQEMTPEELVALIEGEFWLIPSQERSSGAGFLLKQELAKLRSELFETRDT